MILNMKIGSQESSIRAGSLGLFGALGFPLAPRQPSWLIFRTLSPNDMITLFFHGDFIVEGELEFSNFYRYSPNFLSYDARLSCHS